MANAITGVLSYQKTKWIPLVTLQGRVDAVDAGVSIETLDGQKASLERRLTREELEIALWDVAGFDSIIQKMSQECFDEKIIFVAVKQTLKESAERKAEEEAAGLVDELHVDDLGLDEVSLQRDMDSGVR